MSFDPDQVYHDEEDPDEAGPTEAEEDERATSYVPFTPWVWPSLGWRRDQEQEYQAETYGGRPYDEGSAEADTTGRSGLSQYWDEGLITLLVVGGAILFLFPEPVTSSLGVLLMGLGVIAWLVDWAT